MLAGRRAAGLAMGAALALLGVGTVSLPATGVSADYGHGFVSELPKKGTPHVMDGAVQAITQVGNTIIVGGTFTSVSPADTFTDTSDDLVRNRLFAFDATTGVIDPSFNPNMGGEVRSLDTDGTYVYAAGAFGSVGGKTAYKRIVKLDLSGNPVSSFKAKPSAVTNEVVVRGSRVYIGGGFVSISSRKVSYPVGRLAVLDAATGTPDLTAMNLAFDGVYNPSAKNPGTTNVKRFDVTADGTRLAAIGNFATVNGLSRNQLVVIDTSGPTATVTAFATNRFDRSHSVCSQSFDTFTRDLDFSPDGSFFVVSTTGSYGNGVNGGSLCDTTSRWETNQTGNDPSWIDYTGGDTSYGVAVTGDVVYIGGHMRWENNPFQGDQAGPGAVAREGIAALDAVNGLPISWNPGRDRGVGAQALFATPSGLWVGSDTTIFNSQRRGRIAFLPLVGGGTMPTPQPAHLPNTLFAMQPGTPPANVVYRINAGSSSTVAAVDGGTSWSGQGTRVTGGSSASYTSTATMDSTVPLSTPVGIFSTERFGDQDWNFPVTAGRSLTVRLYFANQNTATSQPGQRVFDVYVENNLVLNDFDVVAASGGNRTGTMRSFQVTSDGNVDIDLRNVVNNALINGIEILDDNQPAGQPGALVSRPVDASGVPTGGVSVVDSTRDWSTVRGAFLLDGWLYYGRTDNAFYKRTFDPATGAVGPQQAINLHDDPDNGNRIPFSIATTTGMFYDSTLRRIYYTVAGDSRLFYRYFGPENDMVGAQTFTADSGAVNFSAAAGLTLASGRLIYGSSDGTLRSVSFAGGRVTGSPVTLSSDGTWKYRGLLLPNG